ncbi:MFS transporter [Salinibacterium sp. NYA9b]
MAASYIGVFLFAFSVSIGTAGDSNPDKFSQTSLLLVPILAFTTMTTGTRERFGIRRALPRAVWIPLALAIIAMTFLSGLSVFDVPYSPWLIALVALTVFVPLAAPAIAQLIRVPRSRTPAGRSPEPLSTPVRWNTGIMGAVAGLLISFGTIPIVSALLMIAALAGIAFTYVLNESAWVLPRVGFEWGWIQWTAFGITTSTLFAFAILAPLAQSPSLAATIAAGIAVFLVMLAASALPAHRDARS